MPKARLLVALLLSVAPVALSTHSTQHMTEADVDHWMSELSNWGRWGKQDQVGAVNLITPEKRKAAAALVREGYSISLAHNAETEKAVDNPSPFSHTMLSDGAPRKPLCTGPNSQDL